MRERAVDLADSGPRCSFKEGNESSADQQVGATSHDAWWDEVGYEYFPHLLDESIRHQLAAA